MQMRVQKHCRKIGSHLNDHRQNTQGVKNMIDPETMLDIGIVGVLIMMPLFVILSFKGNIFSSKNNEEKKTNRSPIT